MTIGIWYIPVDTGVDQTGNETGARVEARAFAGENWIGGFLRFSPDGLECCQRVGVQMDGLGEPFFVLVRSIVRRSRWTTPCERVLL